LRKIVRISESILKGWKNVSDVLHYPVSWPEILYGFGKSLDESQPSGFVPISGLVC